MSHVTLTATPPTQPVLLSLPQILSRVFLLIKPSCSSFFQSMSFRAKLPRLPPTLSCLLLPACMCICPPIRITHHALLSCYRCICPPVAWCIIIFIQPLPCVRVLAFLSAAAAAVHSLGVARLSFLLFLSCYAAILTDLPLPFCRHGGNRHTVVVIAGEAEWELHN